MGRRLVDRENRVRLSAYRKYKPSGVERLGEVPTHWEVKRLKYSVSINDEVLPETTDPDFQISYVDIGSIDPIRGIVAVEDILFEDAPSRARRVVRDGDTICSTVRPYLQAIAPVWNPTSNTIVSTGFAVIRPRRVSPTFLSYALREPGLINEIVARSVGVSYPAVNASEIGTLTVPLPAENEQCAIGDFLNRKTSRLDTLVAKKRTLIERLKEKAAALISCTVTRGLPPDAARVVGLNPQPKLKHTGIKWFGEVPEHWEVKRLRQISDVVTVGVVVNPSNYVAEEGVPFLLGGDVREFYIDTTKSKRCLVQVSNGPLLKSRLAAGDLVVVRVGHPGVAAVVPENLEGANCASMMIVRRHKRFVSQWLAYAFNSQPGRDQIDLVQYGAAQKQFNISHAVDFTFPVPPLSEQYVIAEYLDQETTKLYSLVETIEAAIGRLHEYRASLITTAVTGKIDITKSAPVPEPLAAPPGFARKSVQ